MRFVWEHISDAVGSMLAPDGTGSVQINPSSAAAKPLSQKFSNLRTNPSVPMASVASCSGVPAPRRPAVCRHARLLPAAPPFVSRRAVNRRNNPPRLTLARAAGHDPRLPICWTGARTRTASSCPGKAIAPKRCFVASSRIAWVEGIEEELMEIEKSQEQSSVKLKKRPPLRRGKIYPQLSVPEHIPRPSYVGANRPQELPAVRQIHNAEGIAGMRAACKLAAQVLDFAGTLVKPAVTTNEIDRAVHHMIVEAGAYPSPLGYGGFPKSICTSVNECVCHGVPDSTQLQNGDIINIDVNVFLNGYHGGTSRTFVCGEADESIKHFLKAAEECLEKGISVCRDGVNYRKIGKKISKLAYFYGYHVVERFVGHGIGTMLHSEPLILHHANENSGRMVEGQTFTIEPILIMDKAECVTWENGWTTVTDDGSWAAQFEHTVLVTRTGAEILTKV